MSKRNNHLQPNFYLKGFRSNPDEKNPKIWVYEKGKPFYDGKTEQLQNPKLLTTEKAARKRDFYSFEKEDGTKDYEKYENILRDDFEEPAKPVFEKIKGFEIINEEEKCIFGKYISSMVTRGEHGKEMSEYSMNLAKEHHIKEYSLLPQSILKEFENEISKLLESKEIFRESMISKAILIESYIVDMKWNFYLAPEDLKFFTSDNPVCYSFLDKKEGYLFFPVSSDVALYATWEKDKDINYEKVKKITVKKFREKITLIAIKEIYFSEKSEEIVNYINKRV